MASRVLCSKSDEQARRVSWLGGFLRDERFWQVVNKIGGFEAGRRRGKAGETADGSETAAQRQSHRGDVAPTHVAKFASFARARLSRIPDARLTSQPPVRLGHQHEPLLSLRKLPLRHELVVVRMPAHRLASKGGRDLDGGWRR